MRKLFLSLFTVNTLLSFNAIAAATGAKESVVEELAVPGSIATVNYQWSKETRSAQHAVTASVALVTPHTDPFYPASPLGLLSTVNATLIFWGSSWNNATSVSDKMTGLAYWYGNLESSTYTNTVSEYTSLNLTLKSTSTDTTKVSGSSPSNVLAEVCKIVGAGNIDPNGYYAVYSDLKRGNATFCAFHSAGICSGGTKIAQFAFFFNTDDDSGCDPQSPYAPAVGSANSQKPGNIAGGASSYQQSQGLASLANLSAHELAETVTDASRLSVLKFLYSGGYYDIHGNEVGDKCAWTYGPSNTGASPGTVLIGSYDWKLQGEWSNQAQTSGVGGYPTQNGVARGCITGS